MRELTENEKRKKARHLWAEASQLLVSVRHNVEGVNALRYNRTSIVVEQVALVLDKLEEAMSMGLSDILDEDIAQKEKEREARRKEREALKSQAQKYPPEDIRNCIKVKCTE